MRIGFGRDIHRFSSSGRDLILGGVKIPFEKKVVAHSDGDVLYHALGEAFFGAMCIGDLGTHFNENDDKCENMDSVLIIKKALEEIKLRGLKIENIDISIVLERPKLRPYISQIVENVSKNLGIEKDRVSIKAQTNETLDAVGQNNAIEAYAIVLLNN